MMRKEYSGVDIFRMVAALLVVAIHTYPLHSIDITADFVLTRIIGRIAVPFFLIATGYFLLGDINSSRIKKSIKKIGLLYGISILLFLPVNIYTGYLNSPVSDFVKDILFNGTFYHLWYLPASIVGILICYFLIKKFGEKWSIIIALILYILGLLGDSYYGLLTGNAPLTVLYDALFSIFDYTRNGFFYAPIFLILGRLIYKQGKSFKLRTYIIGFVLSMTLMIIEGFMVKDFDLSRHDSMYIMLLPCMFFLFNILLTFKGKSIKSLRNISMIIYIVHPIVIIFIRGVGKVLGLQELFIENNLVHYILVLIVSIAIGIITAMIIARVKKIAEYRAKDRVENKVKNKEKTSEATPVKNRAWIEINLDNLKHNVNFLKNAMPGNCELMAVVKANAYGHGDIEVSNYLNTIGVNTFAVSTIDEGIKLRNSNVKGDILILGYTSPYRADDLVKYKLIQTVVDYNHGKELNATKQKISIHLKIDTGMHRLGLSHNDISEIIELSNYEFLKVKGIYTHLCIADSLKEKDVKFTKDQIQKFYSLLINLKERDIIIPKFHIQSSYGLLNYPELNCDYARIGIALYGVLSSSHDKTTIKCDLKPVLSLKAPVALIRRVPSGEGIGYGLDFITNRDTKVAILPIGYADGLPRNYSETGRVILSKSYAPIIGRICMDQLAIDITDIPNVNVGDTAIIIGREEDKEILVTDVADDIDTITNELLSRLGSRLNRYYC